MAKKVVGKPDVLFSVHGKEFKLIFEKNEYRAYMREHVAWKELKLGSVNPEALKKYIEEKEG